MPRQPEDPVPVTLATEVRLVFAMILSVFFLTSSGFDTSEGRFHYMIAHQLLSEGSLSFAEPRPGIFTVAPNGRTYASHEIGDTLFMLPVAGFNIVIEKALEHRQDRRRIEYITGFFMTLMPAICCAVTTALLYALLRLCFLKSIAAALAGSLAFVFCGFVWNYSRIAYDGVLCMAVLAGAMLSMMQFRRTLDSRLFVLAIAIRRDHPPFDGAAAGSFCRISGDGILAGSRPVDPAGTCSRSRISAFCRVATLL